MLAPAPQTPASAPGQVQVTSGNRATSGRSLQRWRCNVPLNSPIRSLSCSWSGRSIRVLKKSPRNFLGRDEADREQSFTGAASTRHSLARFFGGEVVLRDLQKRPADLIQERLEVGRGKRRQMWRLAARGCSSIRRAQERKGTGSAANIVPADLKNQVGTAHTHRERPLRPIACAEGRLPCAKAAFSAGLRLGMRGPFASWGLCRC